jgi:serine protease Do
MNTALKFGLIFLTAAAAAPIRALAAGPLPDDPGVSFMAGPGPAHPAQGYLGVSVRDIAPDQMAVLKLKEARGAEIVLVDHDAPAGKAGLREHDVILQLNGQAILGEDQLRRLLHDCQPGKTIVLIVSHDGQLRTVSAQMAVSQEEVERQAWEQHITVPVPADDTASDYTAAPASPAPAVRGNSFIGTLLMSPSYTGAMLEKMSPQLAGYFGVTGGAGLLVRSVEPNSPAALSGMQAGDVVLKADSRPVANTNDWSKAIKNSHGHALTVVVLREKKEQTLTLTPDGKKRSSLDRPDQPDPSGPAQFAPMPVPPDPTVARIGLQWVPRT